jgi:hypothetical protein
MRTLGSWVRLLSLALLVDAMMPSVGAFSVKHPGQVECETASPVDASAGSEGEIEMALARAEHPLPLPFATAGFTSESARIAEGHPPPLFRPPIAA